MLNGACYDGCFIPLIRQKRIFPKAGNIGLRRVDTSCSYDLDVRLAISDTESFGNIKTWLIFYIYFKEDTISAILRIARRFKMGLARFIAAHFAK